MTYIKIALPAESRVFLLEDSPMRITWFERRCPHLFVARTVQEMRDYFETNPLCDFISLDHDLGEGAENGEAGAKFFKERYGGTSDAGIIHSWNRAGALAMQTYLPRLVIVPFGQFDLEVEK